MNRRERKRRRGFRFEKEWLRDDECGNIVEDSRNCEGTSDVLRKINVCSNRLGTWSGQRGRDFTKEITSIRRQVSALMTHPTDLHVLEEIKKLDGEIDDLERREETHWAQRSR